MDQVPDGSNRALKRAALDGARKIISECLWMRRDELLGMIWDDTAAEVFSVLSSAAAEAGIEICTANVPLHYQASFGSQPHQQLDREIRDVLNDSSGIIVCVSDMTSGGKFRHELIKEGADHGKRLGHIPGASLRLLAHAVNIDYGPVVRRCDDLALAFTLGRMAELTTFELDNAGQPVKEYTLKLDLDSLERSPITSTGIIPMDTWGNLPGGETFIAPLEERAEGTFVLNAALKKHVLTPPDRLLLRFERGRLQSTDGNGPARAAFDSLIEYALSKADPHYDNLAELGVGVNDGITTLEGDALFDEKRAGTAHVAIGANDGFGGRYSSVIHEDFITQKPSLSIDGQPILRFGEVAFDASYWRETLAHPFSPRQFSDSSKLLKNDVVIHGERGLEGTLRVRRDVASGRVCQYTIGDSATSKLLHRLYSLMRPGISMPFPEFIKKSGLARADAGAALSILVRHGLIAVN